MLGYLSLKKERKETAVKYTPAGNYRSGRLKNWLIFAENVDSDKVGRFSLTQCMHYFLKCKQRKEIRFIILFYVISAVCLNVTRIFVAAFVALSCTKCGTIQG